MGLPERSLPPVPRVFGKVFDGVVATSSYVVGTSAVGGIYFGLFSPSNQTFFDTGQSLTAGAWNHIASTWDGLEMRIYVNGVRQPGALPFTAPYNSTNAPVRIGRGDTNQYWFDGDIDELTLYDRELTAAEVAAVHAAGSLGKCKP